MTPYRCNLCQASGARRLGTFHGRDLVACLACGLRGYHPLPTDAELRALYASADYLAADYFALEDLHTNHGRHMGQAARLLGERYETGGRILEIGPGQGHFLKQCRDLGLEVEAIEFSPPLARALRERFGCVVREKPLEACGLPSRAYQGVAAFDLLEHVRDPMGLLREMWRILAPGGILVLSTVSTDNVLDALGRLLARLGLSGPMAKLHPPYHLYYFTPELLERYLAAAGFTLESLEQENYDPRKATPRRVEQWALRAIYLLHDLTGRRTNLYVTCVKPAAGETGAGITTQQAGSL